MKNKLHVIKIGGNIIDNDNLLNEFIIHFSALEGKKILVHGGGKMATAMSQKLNIPTQLIEGRRITSKDNLDVVTMVYAGLINKKVVALLQKNQCNAIGLSGVDGNLIEAVKRPVREIDYGLVGDIKAINRNLLNNLLQSELTPVFNAICHDGNGQLLNTNADTIATELAISMTDLFSVHLHLCFEKEGVLHQNEVIENITPELFAELKAMKIVQDGMLPKLDNGFHALNNMVTQVHIGSINHIKFLDQLHTTLSL